jgi:hypothetical protein
MSYVMPEEDFTWPCVRSVEICCASCILSIFATIYSFVKHCHKYVIPSVGSLLFLTMIYFAMVSEKVFIHTRLQDYSVLNLSGFFLVCFSYCIRSRFRYLIFPYIYFEHCRIFQDVYLAWWNHKIFTRINLGMEDDDPCCGSIEGIVETMTDYLLCSFVNFFVAIGFVISLTFVIIGYILFHIFLHIWPIFILLGFFIYPVLFIPDLLLAATHHVCSASGQVSLLLLKSLFGAFNFHLRFTYNIQYDILEWLEDREQYNKLCKMLLFLCFYIAIGPRAFIYVNDEASLGYYTDREDLQNYSIVSLSLVEYNALGLEVVVTLLGYVCLLVARVGDTDPQLLFFALAVLTLTLLCELYLYILWPRWTPRSLLDRAVFPTATEGGTEDDPFTAIAEEESKKLSKQKSSVALVDLAY